MRRSYSSPCAVHKGHHRIFESFSSHAFWNRSWGKSARGTCHTATTNVSVISFNVSLYQSRLPGCGISKLDITRIPSRSTVCHLTLSLTMSDGPILFLEWWRARGCLSILHLQPALVRAYVVPELGGFTLKALITQLFSQSRGKCDLDVFLRLEALRGAYQPFLPES